MHRLRSPGGRAAAVAFLVSIAAPPLAAQEPDERFRLRVEGPEAELRTGSEFNARVTLDADAGGIQGWSLAVGHDPETLELLRADPGETTTGIRDGAGPEFLVVNQEPAGGSGVTMAVVFAFATPVMLDAGTGYDLLQLGYAVTADPAADDPCEPIETELAFTAELGDPPVANVITVEGETVEPVQESAPVTVGCPGTLEFTRCEGGTEDVHLEWTFGGGALDAPFLGLWRDGEFLESLSLDATTFDDLDLPPGDHVYTLATILLDDPATPTLVFDTCTATVIPVTVTSVEPGLGDWLGGDELTVRGTGFTSAGMTSVSFVAEGEEPLALEVLEVTDESELRAVTPRAPRLGSYGVRVENELGSAEIEEAFEYGFVRGETNADGKFDISDAVRILDYLFVGDTEPPPCLDAADTTDDGQLDISDGIRILGFLFLGDIPPEPPHPDPGPDPTPDDPLGCLEGPAA